jgi:hypothetical protein
MDFVLPIKKMGIFTRAVLEGIEFFYHPLCIYIITSTDEILKIENSIKKENWLVKKIYFIKEETYFVENFNLTRNDFENVFEKERKKPFSDHREFGWWYQQLIKLGAFSQIPSISQKFVVWDGDLIPLEKWNLLHPINQNYYVAILQEKSKSEFNKKQYDQYVYHLLGIYSKNPNPIGTFVTHHMVMDKDYVKEMMDKIIVGNNLFSKKIHWPTYLLSLCSHFYRFSEYILYSSFMIEYHPKDFFYYPYSEFGERGKRFREVNEINEIIQYILYSLPYSVDKQSCFTFQEIKNYFSLSQEKISYVQFEHVYNNEL